MDFVWIAFLILALVFRGQSCVEATEQTNDSCYEICPPGYFWYEAGDCGNSVKKYCKKCDSGSYTSVKNYITECLKCEICGRSEVVVKPCMFNSNTECGCKPGQFYIQEKLCWDCSSVTNFSNPDYKKKCTTSTTVKTLPSTTTSTIVPMVSMTTKTSALVPIPLSGTMTPDPPPDSSTLPEMPRSKTSNSTSNPEVKPVPSGNSKNHWLFSLMTLATFLVLFWFLVFCGRMRRNQGSYPCWTPNKNVETPAQETIFKEQCSHHGSSPTPLAFIISEETPMMSLCQDPPAHSCGQIPDTDHTVTRQQEQSDCWPAIVLYAIIKEVPLRRWKEFLRLLSVPDQQMERVELEASLGSIEKQYQMLRLWSQRSSASLNDIYSSLHHMDLSGCAQLLQESLEKLQWRQGLTA